MDTVVITVHSISAIEPLLAFEARTFLEHHKPPATNIIYPRPETSEFINGWLSIGWWTKSLHRKWLEITISIHLTKWLFRVPGIYYSKIFQQTKKKTTFLCPSIFAQNSDGCKFVYLIQLKKHSKTLAVFCQANFGASSTSKSTFLDGIYHRNFEHVHLRLFRQKMRCVKMLPVPSWQWKITIS